MQLGWMRTPQRQHYQSQHPSPLPLARLPVKIEASDRNQIDTCWLQLTLTPVLASPVAQSWQHWPRRQHHLRKAAPRADSWLEYGSCDWSDHCSRHPTRVANRLVGANLHLLSLQRFLPRQGLPRQRFPQPPQTRRVHRQPRSPGRQSSPALNQLPCHQPRGWRWRHPFWQAGPSLSGSLQRCPFRVSTVCPLQHSLSLSQLCCSSPIASAEPGDWIFLPI